MMTLRDKIKEDAGLQYVADSLQLLSSAGRRKAMEQPWLRTAAEVEAVWDKIGVMTAVIGDADSAKPLATLRHRLMEMHDIRGTIATLQRHSHLNEVELFEVKAFAYLCIEAAKAAKQIGVAALLAIPDMTAVFDLLDPDHARIANFYVYDSYHPELAPLRKALKEAQSLLDAHGREMDDERRTALQERIGELFAQQSELQQQVVARLSEQLWHDADLLWEALERMADADLLIAKAQLAVEWHCCRPTIVEEGIAYRQLFNPRLRHRNEEQGLRYQPVDVALQQGLTLITGANMAGKTVVLKTVATAQMMAQLGYYLPADDAKVVLVDDVASCIGDEQDEMNGLSSFASEIIKISDTLRRTAGERLLVLIDEPARTTNPVEGKAIIQAILEMLQQRDSYSLVTTHYSQLGIACHRLRVKGFEEHLVDRQVMPDNINQFMDYALVEDTTDEVPQEALRIATLLHCDTEMIALAQKKLRGEA